MLDVHRELAALIEMRDAAGARRLMDDHVKMIRARRVAEHAHDEPTITAADDKTERRTPWTSCAIRNSSSSRTSGCRNGSPRRRATSRDEGLDYEFREMVQSTDGKVARQGRQGRRLSRSFEKGRKSDVSCACHWTVNVAAAKRPRQALRATSIRWRRAACSCRRIRRSRRRRISPACRSRSATSRAATTRPSRRSSSTCRPTRSTCRSTTACCSAAWSC